MLNTIKQSGYNAVRNLAIYPNPAVDFTEFSLDIDQRMFTNVPKITEIEISDLSGKVVKTQKLTPVDTLKMDVSNLDAGIYFVKIICNYGETYTGKLMKN